MKESRGSGRSCQGSVQVDKIFLINRNLPLSKLIGNDVDLSGVPLALTRVLRFAHISLDIRSRSKFSFPRMYLYKGYIKIQAHTRSNSVTYQTTIWMLITRHLSILVQSFDHDFAVIGKHAQASRLLYGKLKNSEWSNAFSLHEYLVVSWFF